MIADKEILLEVRSEWKTVRKTWEMIAANISFSFVRGGITSNEFRSAAYSLTLLFGFTVIEHVLQQLSAEGHFACRSKFVGSLMAASRHSLPWVNFTLVDEAREQRNKIAHQQQWISIEDCERYLNAIENELRAWGILS